MNKLLLQESNSIKAIYRYFPNGGSNFGIVEYLFAEKSAKLTQKATDDDTGHFGNQALLKVEKVIADEKALPLELTQAWC